MIREKKTKKEASGNKAFLIVILISIGMIVLSSLVGFVESRFGILHLETIIYFIVIIAAYILIKNYLTEFRYSFFESELIIEKLLGKKVTPIATIKARDIQYFGKVSDTDWTDKEMHIDYCDINKRKSYAIKYIHDSIIKAVTLNPSEELIFQIQKALDTKHYEEVNEDKIIK